jgi:glycosyltransferase
MKRKIYTFIKSIGSATNYGIGKYIKQIIHLAKDTNMTLTVVELYSQNTREITVTQEDYGEKIAVPYVSGGSLFPVEKSDSRYTRSVVYLLREYIPDDENNLFHLNYMEGEYLAIWLRKLFKARIVLTVHYTNWNFSLLGDMVRLRKILKPQNNDTIDLEAEIIRKSVEQDRRIIEQCDRTVCIAKHSYNMTRELYCADKNKLALICNGLKDGYRKLYPGRIEHLKKQYHFNPDEKIILYAGRLDEVKGVSFLIRAFQALLMTRGDIRLVIAGNGNFDQLLSDAKKSCAKITFTGYLQKRELYEFYRMADMGVVCSIHEEFGLVAVEMMMHALPLIVTDTGGLSEIVENNVTGLKVPVKTVRGKRQPDTGILCSRMKWMLEHPDEAKKLGKQARKRFLKQYELSVWKDKMLHLYSEI